MKYRHQHAFTIVELILVIAVIGILATITIISYGGWRKSTTAAVLQSDLEQSSSQLKAALNTSGVYPTSLSAANLPVSNGTTYTYTSTGSSYCLVASSSDGSIVYYVTDTITQPQVGTCSLSGLVSTFAGSGAQGSANGASTAASFYLPSAVAVDSSGNVYVADTHNFLIRKITPAGVVTTLAGSGTSGSANGTGTAASFGYPIGIAVDSSGNVYVADEINNLIRKITPAGVVTTFAGSGAQGSTNGTGTAASFNYPTGVAVDGSGNVYVTDGVGNLIRKITSAGVVTTLAGSGAAGSTNGTGTAASFYTPRAIAVDGSGNLYVADAHNDLIRKITSAGVVTTLAGSGTAGSANGTGTAASFNAPDGVAVDSSGNVYVTDGVNNLIRKITPAGVVTTFAGSGAAGSTNGTGTAASFNNPSGDAIDSSGNLYVGDMNNNLIRVIKL